MRAVVIQRFGTPDGMEVIDVPPPRPGPGQVVITAEAIGVGGSDAIIRRGTLSGYGFEPGLIPGSEVAGTVTALGVDVDQSWLHRRVWAFTGTGGGYVEQALARLADIAALPHDLSSINAVTLGSAAPVAHFALEHAHFSPGESVLVRGAAGSIGIAAVQIAARHGAGVLAVTTSSWERGERLRGLGASRVLDRSGREDPTTPAPPEGYDVIIDIVGGPELPAFVDRLAPNGRLVLLGAVAGLPPADFGNSLIRSFQLSRSVATFSLDTVPVDARNTLRAAQFTAASRGELHAVVHDVLPLDQAAEAHRQMDAGAVFGRVVLTP